MGNTKRDKEYLGIDTNVLVAFLDKEHPDNPKTEALVEHQYHAVFHFSNSNMQVPRRSTKLPVLVFRAVRKDSHHLQRLSYPLPAISRLYTLFPVLLSVISPEVFTFPSVHLLIVSTSFFSKTSSETSSFQ
ncbi:MAG: hypothetical protein EF806_01665 [Candidatus Methanoliparum thermophilum]|uniref:Uncharacterized protein n=1 Tax=Methanoliparum thermophilum TaxID=2491083 RepID=A0A520KTE7_METT2|nr:MAG: hypothetical protein EF806_01665 [Candidatus Methanoliparum thermophilum]